MQMSNRNIFEIRQNSPSFTCTFHSISPESTTRVRLLKYASHASCNIPNTSKMNQRKVPSLQWIHFSDSLNPRKKVTGKAYNVKQATSSGCSDCLKLCIIQVWHKLNLMTAAKPREREKCGKGGNDYV